MSKVAIIAIGGNSITKAGQRGTIEEQYTNTAETAEHIVDMIEQGYNVVITHGNGPQVGNILRRSELACQQIQLYPLPLDICGADSQGGMGYMILQVLSNAPLKRGIERNVTAIVTQTLVDREDPSFQSPSKPIGTFMDEKDAGIRRDRDGWDVIEDAGRGWRRVVPSPIPIDIIEKKAINTVIDSGSIVIAVGGGGIPVIRKESGEIMGVEAVIDKDRASSLLGTLISADLVLISTDVAKVCLNFKKPDQKELDTITVSEAKRYSEEGHFLKGSMGPKVEAAIQFLENGGKEVIITSPENIGAALAGKSGTHIVPD